MPPLRRLAVLSTLALATVSLQCSRGDDAATWPHKTCVAHVWVRPASAASEVRVVGSWDGWSPTGTLAEPYGSSGWSVARLPIPPGEYGYLIVDAGAPRLDERAPLTKFDRDREVSLLVVDDCRAPSVVVDRVDSPSDGAITLSGTYVAPWGGGEVDPASVVAKTDDGRAFGATAVDPATGVFTVSASGVSPGKHAIAVTAGDGAGNVATAKASAFVGAAADTWRDGLLYQVVIDRFRGDGGVALSPPKTPGSRAGGTLDGVRAEIEKGTFDDLGVTALWLSPVYTNPDDPRPGRDGHAYEGYHGYWPADSRGVDPKIGGEEALHAVIDAAHRRGIRVLFDIVPHHVDRTNPRLAAHPDDGWFDDAAKACVCGDPGCDWGAHILDCRFASYLPNVRFQSDAATHAQMDDAVFWMDAFDADGVRIDAVPMMPRGGTRRILAALRETLAPREARFAIGEVFTGPGRGGIDSIRYFLGPDGLDAAFDFPLLWEMRDVIATGATGFDDLDALLDAWDVALTGSGSLLGRTLGNHDTSRFASASAGDDGGDPWTSPPAATSRPDVYAKQRIALALLLTLPGLPVVYYGDEIALAGGNDPDSRRVMPDPSTLSPLAAGLRADVARLGRFRRCSTSLRRGTRRTLSATKNGYAMLRAAPGDFPVVALFSTASVESQVFVGSAMQAGTWIDVLGGESITVSGAAAQTVAVPALGARVLVPQGSPCP